MSYTSCIALIFSAVPGNLHEKYAAQSFDEDNTFDAESIDVALQGRPDTNNYIGLEGGLPTFSFEQKLDQQVVFPIVNLTGGIAW